MKNSYIAIASALLLSTAAFAQKDQIKAAEKALKSGSAAIALTSLAEAATLLANAKDEEVAQFYYLKGSAHLDLAKKHVEAGKNYVEAAKAFQVLFDTEKKSGKSKYTKLGEVGLMSIESGLKQSAFKDYQDKKYAEAGKKFYALYNLDPKQTDFLYNASNATYLAEDDAQALIYLNELIAKGYTGERTDYTAVNKLTKEKVYYDSLKARDEAVKRNEVEQPGEDKVLSKQGDIYRQLASILVKQGKVEEAKAAYAEARKRNATDPYLALSEANLYYQTKDLATYQKLITQILEKDPDNKDLIFNLGVVSYTNKNYDDAEKFFNRVIAIDPKYGNAYFNLAAIKIDAASRMLDDMNKLGTTAAENKKYDAMKKQRDELLVSIMNLLEKTVELDPANDDAKLSLASVYSALEMTAKAKAMKAQVKQE